MSFSLPDSVLTDMRRRVLPAMPETCTVYHSTETGVDTICRVDQAKQTQPAITQDPQTLEHLWILHLPYGTPIAFGDVIVAMGRLFGVLEDENPRSNAVDTRVTCQRLGVQDGGDGTTHSTQIAWANATVTVVGADDMPVYTDRRVRLVFPPPYEQGGPGSGGPLIVPAQLWDVPDTTYALGHKVTVTALSGSTLVPAQQQTFTLEFASYEPGRNLVRCDLIGSGATGEGGGGAAGGPESIFLPNATVLCMRRLSPAVPATQVGDPRRVNLVFPTVQEKVVAGAVTLPALLKDGVNEDWLNGDHCEVQSLDGVTALPPIVDYVVNGVVRHPAPRVYLEAALVGSPVVS